MHFNVLPPPARTQREQLALTAREALSDPSRIQCGPARDIASLVVIGASASCAVAPGNAVAIDPSPRGSIIEWTSSAHAANSDVTAVRFLRDLILRRACHLPLSAPPFPLVVVFRLPSPACRFLHFTALLFNWRAIALSAQGFDQTIKLVLETCACAGTDMNELQPGHMRAGNGRASSFTRNDVLMKFSLSDRKTSDRFVTPNESLAHCYCTPVGRW
jgi:hypothetical protein